MTKELYYLTFPDKKVSKKDAVKAGCYVSEFSDITTKNDRVQSTQLEDSKKDNR